MGQHSCSFHAEFQALVEMGTVKHAAMDMCRGTLHKGLVEAIVATVSQAGALHILLVAVYGIVTCRSP